MIRSAKAVPPVTPGFELVAARSNRKLAGMVGVESEEITTFTGSALHTLGVVLVMKVEGVGSTSTVSNTDVPFGQPLSRGIISNVTVTILLLVLISVPLIVNGKLTLFVLTKAVPLVDGASLLVAIILKRKSVPGLVGTVGLVTVMFAFPLLQITEAKFVNTAIGVGSTCTVVTMGVPSAQPAIFGVTVYVTVITALLLLVNVPPIFNG